MYTHLRTFMVLTLLGGASACGTSNREPDGNLDAASNAAAPDRWVDGDQGLHDAADSGSTIEAGRDSSDGDAATARDATANGDAFDAEDASFALDDGAADAANARDSAADGDASEALDTGPTPDAAKDSGADDSAPARDSASSQDGGLAQDASGDVIGGSCDHLMTGPPQDGGDLTYSWAGAVVPNCLSNPFCQITCGGDLLSGLLACSPVQGGYFWAQGSAYIRVAGRKAGTCVYEIGIEVEGSVSYTRCTTPMPAQPWKGLYYVSSASSSAAPDLASGLDNCQVVTTCSIPDDGPNPCSMSTDDPPMCPVNGLPGAC